MGMRKTIGIVAGVAGTLFLGYYCFRKLQRRRKSQKGADSTGPRTTFSNKKNDTVVQRYLREELIAGDLLIMAGDIENGLQHLANANNVTARLLELYLARLKQTEYLD